MKGLFKARAITTPDAEGKPMSRLQLSKTKGTKHFFILFEIISEGEFKGRRVPWEGWLTPDAEARTIESLLLCGLENDDLSNAIGIDKNIVEIDVEEESREVDVEKIDEATGEPYITKEKRIRSRVRWVNDPLRSASVHKAMDTGEAQAFAARFKGSIQAARQRRGQPASAGSGTSFDFGANAPPPPTGAAPSGGTSPQMQAPPAKPPVSEEAKNPNPNAGY
jgi:hypothetical protein